MKAFKGPKAKIVRRFGINIFETDKYDRILGRRKFPPGMHGPTKRIGKMSEYGKQLIEKQKMKFMYGMTEKQFRNFYKKAERKKGATGMNLLQMLETRLDNFLFRSGWAASRAQARQLIKHNHILLNKKKANIPSIIVKTGNKIDMGTREASRSLVNDYITDNQNQYRDVPNWINSKKESSEIVMGRKPERDEMPAFLSEQLVVELYSK